MREDEIVEPVHKPLIFCEGWCWGGGGTLRFRYGNRKTQIVGRFYVEAFEPDK